MAKRILSTRAEVFPGVGESTGIINAEKEELNRLRKENRELKMDVTS